jgi:hypothetical protein
MVMSKDELEAVCGAIRSIGKAITPNNAGQGTDAAGGHVESLTEAIMGITSGLFKVADGLESIASAIREKTEQDREASIRAATCKYREDEDTLGRFLSERTTQDGLRVPKSELYEAYVKWMEDNGYSKGRILTATTFGKGILAAGITDGKSGATRFWTGLALREVTIDD